MSTGVHQGREKWAQHMSHCLSYYSTTVCLLEFIKAGRSGPSTCPTVYHITAQLYVYWSSSRQGEVGPAHVPLSIILQHNCMSTGVHQGREKWAQHMSHCLSYYSTTVCLLEFIKAGRSGPSTCPTVYHITAQQYVYWSSSRQGEVNKGNSIQWEDKSHPCHIFNSSHCNWQPKSTTEVSMWTSNYIPEFNTDVIILTHPKHAKLVKCWKGIVQWF